MSDRYSIKTTPEIGMAYLLDPQGREVAAICLLSGMIVDQTTYARMQPGPAAREFMFCGMRVILDETLPPDEIRIVGGLRESGPA